MPRLEGKTAIVTGASRGIGAEISRLFAAEGARVICAARTVNEGDHPLEGSLAKTVADINDAGGEATPVAANISLPEDCEMLVSEARRIYGPVDVLVNNAALTYYLPIKDFPNQPVDALMGGQLPRSVHPQSIGIDRHDRTPNRQYRQHIVRLGGWTGSWTRTPRRPTTAPVTGPKKRRWNGSPKALAQEVYEYGSLGDCGGAISGGSHSGNRVPSSGRRDGRSSGRTVLICSPRLRCSWHLNLRGQRHWPGLL